jgi:hypothetical protein
MNLDFFDIFVRPRAFVQWSGEVQERMASCSPPDDRWIACGGTWDRSPGMRTQDQQESY